MALIACEGFDIFDDSNDLFGPQTRWSPSPTIGSANNLLTTSGRFGGGCLRVSDQQAVGTTTSTRTLSSIIAMGTTAYFCFAWKCTARVNATSNEGPIIRIIDAGGTNIASVTMNSITNLLSVRAESATSASSFAAALNTWYWIELKVVTNASGTGGTVELRVNGSVAATITSTAVGSTNNKGILAAQFLSGTTNFNLTTSLFDDLIVLDSTGSINNTYPGDSRIDTQRPTADSATQQWTSSSGTAHNDVDDTLGASNGDTDYISSSTAGQIARFTDGALSGTSVTVTGVAVRVKARKTDAGQRTLRATLHSGSTDADGDIFDPGITYGWNPGSGANVYDKNPSGSVAWTDTTINNLEVGVKLQS